MMEISRRRLLYLSALAPWAFQYSALAGQQETKQPGHLYPRTVAVLQASFNTEMGAHAHYLGYASKALSEKYPNIAYLFTAFSFSEKIHAENFRRLLAVLGHDARVVPGAIVIGDTKRYLQNAAKKELEKIETTYPHFIKELETESYEEAIMNCMYSWKSHRQHEGKLKEIDQYAGMFFGPVSDEIEGMKLDIHVCRVCGSTIDKAPDAPCVICNKSRANYQKIRRPA